MRHSRGQESAVRKCVTLALVLDVLLTAGALVFALLVLKSPALSLKKFAALTPGANPYALAVSVALTWLLVTCVLVLAYLGRITRGNVVTVTCGCGIAMAHLSILAEAVTFGDWKLYAEAAARVLAGAPLPGGYLYPPLWAFFLAGIQSLWGPAGPIVACFALNQLSLWAFFVLGSLFLRRCGLSLALASILLFVAMLINVPLRDNTVFVQVNLLLADFVLVAVLLAERYQVFSALSLALGTHLKIVPVLLVPVFAYFRRSVWLLAFVGFAAAVVAMALLTNDGSYYLQSIENLRGWQMPSMRSVSVDSFLASAQRYLGFNLPFQAVAVTLRALCAAWLYLLAYWSVRGRVFARAGSVVSDGVTNAALPLLFLMPAISPTVWIHHLVMLIIPAVIIFTRLGGAFRSLVFGLAYFTTFLLPAFEYYPWSYLRLGGWLALLVLMSDAIFRPAVPHWFRDLDRGVNSMLEGLARAPERS